MFGPAIYDDYVVISRLIDQPRSISAYSSSTADVAIRSWSRTSYVRTADSDRSEVSREQRDAMAYGWYGRSLDPRRSKEAISAFGHG